jgi:hypothetical protein
MKDCDSVVALGRELKVGWRSLYRWRAAAEIAETASAEERAAGREAALRAEIAALKASLADKTLEVDFFEGALRKIEALRHKREPGVGEAVTTRSGK